jgi:Leucine-rich repeat (LRR) protein
VVDNPQTSLLADKATGHSPSYLGVIYWIKSLGGLVSVDNEGNIESVRVGMLHAPESDLLLDRLHTFTKLRSLDLMCCDVTDVSLEKLKGLTQLQELKLRGSSVTGSGLENLNGLTQLQRLDLSFNPVSDVGLGHIKSLTQLRDLELSSAR